MDFLQFVSGTTIPVGFFDYSKAVLLHYETHQIRKNAACQ